MNYKIMFNVTYNNNTGEIISFYTQEKQYKNIDFNNKTLISTDLKTQKQNPYIVISKEEHTIFFNKQSQGIRQVVDLNTLKLVDYVKTQKELALELENTKKTYRQQAFKVYDDNKYKIDFLLLEDDKVVKKESGYTADKIAGFLQSFIDINAFPEAVNTVDGAITIPSKEMAIAVQNEVKKITERAFKNTYYATNLSPILNAINSAKTIEELKQISITKPPAVEINLINY